MTYDDDLADRVRAVLGGAATEKPMFGGLAFLLTDGGMCVAVSGEGGLMVRVDPAETEALLDEPGTGPVVMGARGPVTGWVRVAAEALVDDGVLERWVRRGVERVRTLPGQG